MTADHVLSEIASIRLTAAEKRVMVAEAEQRGLTLAQFIRRRVVPAQPPAGNPYLRRWSGRQWEVLAAPGRQIEVRTWNVQPGDAVGLARALLCATEVAELPEPAEAAG